MVNFRGRGVAIVVRALFVLVAASGSALAFQPPAKSPSEFRNWNDDSGKFRVRARYLEKRGDHVKLQREDGSDVSVPLSRLSEADRAFVSRILAPGGESRAPIAAARRAAMTSEEVERATSALCEQIDKGYRGKTVSAKPRFAVVEFSDLSRKATDLGRILSEELITKLFTTGKYSVVERFLLNKAIAEHKLQVQGIVDTSTAKELGKILGVDAVVSGTISDLGDALRVNGRVISTETGEILSVAAVNMSRAAATTRSPEKSKLEAPPEAEKGDLVFHEDFSRYDDGDLPDWGDNVRVEVGKDGRKWLVASKNGMYNVGKKILFPEDSWYFQFDFTARVTPPSHERSIGYDKTGSVTSSISLADEQGKQYRLGWQIGVRKHVFVLPDGTVQDFGFGTTVPADGQRRENATAWLKGRTLRITKKDDVLKVFIDGRQVFTDDFMGLGRIARFSVDLCAHDDRLEYNAEYLYLTNFKIGRL